jgi:pilus assembly protein CpaF
MRPDRIIIGEVRGGEVFDLLQAMNTGHEGSMTSVHANTPGESLSRMETLYLLAGYEVPYHVIRKQMASAIDFIIQISRDRDGNRMISHISELTGMEKDVILLQHIALHEEGNLVSTGIAPKSMKRIHEKGGLSLNFVDNF